MSFILTCVYVVEVFASGKKRKCMIQSNGKVIFVLCVYDLSRIKVNREDLSLENVEKVESHHNDSLLGKKDD